MKVQLPNYAELQCVSNYTFLRGASHPDELVERAIKLGYRALAITDECSLAGVVRAHVATKNTELQLLIGSQFQLTSAEGDRLFSIILIAMNREGYGNLSELITVARTRTKKGTYLLTTTDIDAPEGELAHLCCMPDCLAILVPDYGITHSDLAQQVRWLSQTMPGRSYMALTLLSGALDHQHRTTVEAVGAEFQIPVVATGDVCMHVRSRKLLQDTLTAIRVGASLAECGFQLAPNAEQHLRSRLRLANLYPQQALDETIHLANRCHFSLDELRYEYPDELVPAGETATSYLRKETYAGAQWRFPSGTPHAVQQQLEHELSLIEEMAYEPYFLTVYDIVRFARKQHILCQGRGSAANSAVCYCLGITEVDPARGTLLFERFISKERNEPPDIDVDFEHQRREEVIQYIYNKYGRLRAALTGVVISYRPRSALRDVGKALGVDLSIVDQVAKSQRWWDSKSSFAERYRECGLDPESFVAQQWQSLTTTLMRFPRHLSQHPGGFVIARGKLSRLVPIENAAMPDRSIVQWDKDDLDALGLLKIDILALGMLSAIRRTLDLVSQQRGKRFELQDIPAEDPATYEMICQADTVGVFQIESRAQMAMLPRLQPRTFYDLVIEIALIRPGPIQGDMVHPYLRRRQGIEPVSYPSPEIKNVLSRTLGIPIFQEQVMQVAMVAGGFTPGEADRLRRAMAAWKRKGGLEQFDEKLQTGMKQRGYTQEFADAIIRQIRGFAEYGFPESHATSFALLAYASSWLKRHEPAAFFASLLNSLPMGFYSASQLVQDARRHHVEVREVDVSISGWDAVLEPGNAVRLGFNRVSGLSHGAAERIEKARSACPFFNVADLAERAELSRTDLQALASANVLKPLAGHRRQAVWEAVVNAPDKGLLRKAPIVEEQIALKEATEGESIVADYRSLGLTLGRHPLALLRPILTKKRFLPAEILNTFSDRQFARGCGIVTMRQRPGTAKGVIFVGLEDETGIVNVIVWPALAEKQRKELLGSTLLGVYGIWQCQNNVRHLIAKRLVDLSPLLGGLNSTSRDFM